MQCWLIFQQPVQYHYVFTGCLRLNHFPLCQFPLCQFPFGQLPTSSIPTLSISIWSMLTKWELTKWEVDEVERFTILYTFNRCYISVNFLCISQIYCQEMTKLYGGSGCDETAVNLSSFQNHKSSLYCSRLQRFPTSPQI